MRRVLKWIGITVGGLLALALLALGVISLVVEGQLRDTYTVPPVAVTAPPAADSAFVAAGERLARTRGCAGCHGPRLEGEVFFDIPGGGRLVAPNLTRIAAEYDDAALERSIRHGVKPDGHSVIGMPSEMFYHLADADLRAIIAFIRSVPRVADSLPATSVGPLFRVMWVLNGYSPEAGRIDHAAARPPADPTAPEAYGRYLAMTSCSECHGPDLRGIPKGAPSLAVVAGYSESQFRDFLKTGTALGGRELQLMSRVARGRFAYFTDAEIHALYTNLKTLAGGS